MRKRTFKKNLTITDSFEKTIESTKDLTIDFIEVTIDDFIHSRILKNLPFVKSVLTITNGVISIRECHLFKNTMAFVQELHNKNCDKLKIEKYKKTVLKSDKRFNQELERVIVILDKQTEIIKSQYLAKLFNALIENNISIDEFEDYSEVLDRIYLSDLTVLLNKWEELKDCYFLAQDNEVKALKRLSRDGIGEVVFPNDIIANDSQNIQYFGYDEYSQKFVNILLDSEYIIENTNNPPIFKTSDKILRDREPKTIRKSLTGEDYNG